MAELKPGLSATIAWEVSDKNTAIACKSGSLSVFGTPALSALMECAACEAIADALPEGSTSVGTQISLSHSAPSPVGERVSATATLTAVDGRRLEFEITAEDSRNQVGTATHKRAIVDIERFMSKL